MSAAKLISRRPADGRVLGESPIHTQAEVDAAVQRARIATATWGALGHRHRRPALVGWRRSIAASVDELAELIHDENGKSRVDAVVEVYLALSYLDHALRRAGRVLRTAPRTSGWLLNYRASVHYHPLGVVAVIGPWNYPLSTPMGSIAFALAAGNTVVFKPSELTPLVGQKLVDLAATTLPQHVLQVVTGDGATGAALAGASVDKIAFTGSTATGRRVMARAAERLTPVVLELGGKDAMLVLSDADVDDAASAAVFGAMTNSGQACISVERVYVHRSIYDRFTAAVVRQVNTLRVGDDGEIGPMTRPQQIDTIRQHLDQAVAAGAKILTGGSSAITARFVPPTVLIDVAPDLRILHEETFGPVLPIIPFDDLAEAIRAINASEFGLGSAIFSRSDGEVVARQIHAGMTSINGVVAYSGIPALPFGGVGASGFGRIHGDEGLREFSRVQSVATRRVRTRFDLLTFDMPRNTTAWLKRAIRLLYGGGVIDRAREWVARLWPF